jgi:hypothetical protein
MAHRHSQVSKLAQNAASVQAQTTESASQIPQHYATFKVELLLDEDNNVQTTNVIYDQDKTKQDHWDGWVEPKIMNFFVRSAGLHRPLPGLSAPPESISSLESAELSEAATPPARSPAIPVEEQHPHSKPKDALNGVLIVGDLTTTQLKSDMPQYLLPANEAFLVRLLLGLSEVRTSPSRQLHCEVSIWARDLGTGARQVVGQEQTRFVPADHVPCRVECRIPSPGTYRLEAVITLALAPGALSPRSNLMAWLESGLLVIY